MGLEVIRAIQRFSSPWLDVIMEGLTLFGEKMILAAAFCAVYWCVDKRLGRCLAMALGASLCLNGAIKDFFKIERLFGAPGVASLRVETATGYSFPSGHTQTAAAFWGGLSIAAKRPVVRAVFAAMVVAVGFSRLYLGVHYPADVLAGGLAGALCSALMYHVMIRRGSWWLALAFCLCAGAAAVCVCESADTRKAIGMLAGIISGLYFEERFAGFEVAGTPVSKRLVRYALGMAAVGACYALPKLVLTDMFLWDYIRYALTAFVAAGLAPYMFRRLGI